MSKKRLTPLVLFLAFILITQSSKAQLPSPPHPFRVINYRPDLMWGNGAPFSTIKFYYAESGSFLPKPGEQPFKELISDEKGSWIFSPTYENMGEFTGPVVVSMTRPGGNEIFESATIGPDEVFILNPRPCAEKQSIAMWPGIVTAENETKVRWRDRSGNIVSDRSYLNDAPPGTYTLEYTNIGGRTYRSLAVTFEGIPKVESRSLTLNCSQPYIDYTGEYSGAAASFRWTNEADGSPVGTTQRVRLTAGTYRFTVSNNENCSASATITVNPPPPVATVVLGANPVKNADCNRSNGSITGIRVIANGNESPIFRWKDTRGNTYNTLDIHGLLPDKYTLETYSTTSPCPSVLAELEVKEEYGIELDKRFIDPRPASCGEANGSLTGLSAPNASIFKWFRGTDRSSPVWTELNLKNVAAGDYTLIMGNQYGCTSKEYAFQVADESPAISLTSTPLVKADHCGLGKGSISGATFNTQVTYVWKNAEGKELAKDKDLIDVPAGNYTLIASNFKCSKPYPYTIGNIQSIVAQPIMKDIQVCSASAVFLRFKEISETYRIYNSAGLLLAQSSSHTFKVKIDEPGIYHATLSNGTCESAKTPFKITFGASALKIPAVFSPNGDGINDKWLVKGLDIFITPEVKIFDRQGSVVFHSYGQLQPFDGKSNGKDLPVGVYYYKIQASPECPPASGSLTLVR